MKKGEVLLCIISFIFCIMLFGNTAFAQDIGNDIINNDKQVEENNKEDLEKENRKKEIIKMIDECLDEIRSKLMDIENKEAKVKKQKEFENYPAIRLNVDTPVFGFISMVDNKLKIRRDVSTVDVANGYSIKDIVNKNKIKLPDFTVGSIVVTTRDVAIDEKMSYEDANLALLKIMQYISQLDSANEFLDFQINRTFRGYIDKEKSDSINDIKNRNSKITSSLIELDKKVVYLHIIKIDDNTLKEINQNYDNISLKNKNINTSVKDMLMSQDTLGKLQKDIIKEEEDLTKLTKTIDKEYDNAINKIDVEKMLKAMKEELTLRKDAVKKYIDDSVYTKKIDSSDEENNDNKKQENIEDKSNEIITKYEVTSKNTLDYLNSSIATIDEKIAKYTNLNKDKTENETNIDDENKDKPISQEVANKEDVTKVEIKELTKEEKKVLTDEIYRIYNDFLSRENKFYLDNTNFLINDTTKKTSDLIGKTDGDILSYMKYMYIELPDKLKDYINSNNMNSKRELKKLTKSLQKELETIVNSNVKVTKLYNEMIQNELKS